MTKAKTIAIGAALLVGGIAIGGVSGHVVATSAHIPLPAETVTVTESPRPAPTVTQVVEVPGPTQTVEVQVPVEVQGYDETAGYCYQTAVTYRQFFNDLMRYVQTGDQQGAGQFLNRIQDSYTSVEFDVWPQCAEFSSEGRP